MTATRTISTLCRMCDHGCGIEVDVAHGEPVAPEPRVRLRPATALAHGIAEGDPVEVRSPHGAVHLAAELTEDIRADTFHIPQGWVEASANELTTGDGADPLSGFPNLKSMRCRIRRDEHRPL